MRRGARWTLVSLLTILSGRAVAQTEADEPSFGDKGHIAISVERLFGYVHASQKTSQPASTGGDSTTTDSVFSVLGSPITAATSIYTFPRVAFDLFVAPGLSIGASISYFHVSESLGQLAMTTTNGSASLSGIVAAPRIGYAARLSPTVWLWPRAGITYVNASNDTFGTDTGTVSVSLFAATIEAPLTVAVVPRALILVGPTADIGLSGTRKSSSSAAGPAPNRDIKETDFGVQAGVLLFL